MDPKDIEIFRNCMTEMVSEKDVNVEITTFKNVQLLYMPKEKIDTVPEIRAFLNFSSLNSPLVVACKSVLKLTQANSGANSVCRTSFTSEVSSKHAADDSFSSGYEGQPLELQSYADLSSLDSLSFVSGSPASPPCSESRQYQFTPIFNHQDARYLLSLYSVVTFSSLTYDNKLPPLLVLCDVSDLKNTAFVGMEKIIKDDRILLKTTWISSKGSGRLEDYRKSIDITVNSMQKTCFAEYNVFEAPSVRKYFAASESLILLDVHWPKSFTFLQKPPGTAEVFVKIRAISGDMRSPVYDQYKEVCILKTFAESLQSGEVKWVVEENEKPLIEKLKVVIEDLKLGDAYVEKENDKEFSYDNCEVNKLYYLQNLFKERSDNDFTDVLWKVLCYCSSYDELVDCLYYVFEELKSRKLQPLVHRTNETKMAQMVHKSYIGDLIVPNLVGSLPLQLLTEIGIEKLCGDYIDIFVGNNFTTMAHLQYFVDRSVSLEESMERLEKLHNVVEIVSLLKVFLKVPTSVISSSARLVLQHYEKNPVNTKHIFTFPIPAKVAIPLFDTLKPTVWKLVVEDIVKNGSETTTYCFSVRQHFSHLHPEKEPPLDSGSEPLYYFAKSEERLSSLK